MSARSSARPRSLRRISRWLSLGLLCLSMIGCKTWSPCAARSPTATPQEMPVRLVSDTKTSTEAARQSETWQLRKAQPESAMTAATAESDLTSMFQEGVTPASLESELWKSDEPAPLVPEGPRVVSEYTPPDSGDDGAHCGPCLGCDLENARSRLWDDTKGLVNWNNGLILAAAGGVAIGFRERGVDKEVRERVAEHPLRWGQATKVLNKFGDVKYQAPVLLGVYGYSLWKQDEELHDVMGSVLSSVVITGVSTTALKYITNTERPSNHSNNGHYGFPSYHTSSTFAIAAVLDEYYGCKVGLPAYLLAGAVGFSRLDQQDHDLSDVVFGGALGFVIGKTVAGRHLCGNSNIQVEPYFHPTDGSPGVAFETKF